MSFDTEWSSVRSESTANVSMRLNQLPAEAGGGSSTADLSANQDKLGAIGNAAFLLHGRLNTTGKKANASTSEAATMMTVNGFRTGAAMATVRETWGSQLQTLLDACANISNHLDYSAASHAQDEKDIAASLSTSKINEYLK